MEKDGFVIKKRHLAEAYLLTLCLKNNDMFKMIILGALVYTFYRVSTARINAPENRHQQEIKDAEFTEYEEVE